MNAQNVILGSRVEHVRELNGELAKLRAENADLRNELTSLKSHFDLALTVAIELAHGEVIEIWDGWNLILGAKKVAKSPGELQAQAQATGRRIWIVYDGPRENVVNDGRVRVSYTGGKGEHRADKFITDFVRMARYLGFADRVQVQTFDKDFLAAVRRLQDT